MKSIVLSGCLITLLGAGVATLLAAQSPVDAVSILPEREAAATAFAREHHSELAELLEGLKGRDQQRYGAAINELFQASERLARLQTRSPDRYEMELDLWKLDSRIRLLTAQSVSGMPEERRAELKKLLLARQELKIRQLQAERVRLTARLEKVDASLAEMKKSGEEQAEKELERLLKSVKGKSVSVGRSR